MSKNGSTKPAQTKSGAERNLTTAKLAQSGMIRARISPDLKAEAERILDQIGLSPSDAIRMFYKQITASREALAVRRSVRAGECPGGQRPEEFDAKQPATPLATAPPVA
jgi:hypothetical protein